MKKINKFKLNKETISNLTKEENKYLLGGYDDDEARYTWPTIGTATGFSFNTYCSQGPTCQPSVGGPCIA